MANTDSAVDNQVDTTTDGQDDGIDVSALFADEGGPDSAGQVVKPKAETGAEMQEAATDDAVKDKPDEKGQESEFSKEEMDAALEADGEAEGEEVDALGDFAVVSVHLRPKQEEEVVVGGVGKLGDDVVVGESEEVVVGLPVAAHDLFGIEVSVGAGGVGVEIAFVPVSRGGERIGELHGSS